MAKTHKFKSTTGSPITIFRPNHPDPIRVDSDKAYETGDKDEIAALKASPEVAEVKSK